MVFFVLMLGLCVFSKESSQSLLGRPQLSGYSEALVGKYAGLTCEVQDFPENEHILLQLFKQGDRSKFFAESTSLNGEAVNFNLVPQLNYEGNLECVASGQNNSDIKPTVSNIHYLKVIEPVKGAKAIVRSGPQEFFEGKTLELDCELDKGNHVSYKWLLNEQPIAKSPLHHVREKHLSIYRPTSADSGSYMCVATNIFNNTRVFTSNSSAVIITVKDVVSPPDISFTIVKEDSQNYSAVVTCESTRGTPPVTFSLYNADNLVGNVTVEERTATFNTSGVFNKPLGWLQCRAENGDRVAYSEPLPFEVVTVRGPVTIHSDIYQSESYAITGLALYCKAAKGTHPRHQWFLNKTLLHDRGSFYSVHYDGSTKQSILNMSVGRISTGTYHCEVSDSFDNTTVISSRKYYVDKEVLNRLPDYVVAIVFGCFSFLVVLVFACCWIGVLIRRKNYGEKSLVGLEMRRMVIAYENELDLSEYNEDVDVARVDREDESDQVSDISGDEWSQYGGEEELKDP